MRKRNDLVTLQSAGCRRAFSPPARRVLRGRTAAYGNTERGAQILEFGLLLTVLLSLLLGIVTMARAFNIYQTITRAAREGAREAVLPTSVADGNQFMDSSGVSQANSAVFQNYIAPALEAANLDPGKVAGYSEQVTWLDAGDTNQQCGVVISFQYPYSLHLPMLDSNLMTLHIPTHVQMRLENQPSNGTCQ